MENLKMISKDGVAVSYKLTDIKAITYSLACNVLNDSDMNGNGIKPCEMLMIISFQDNSTSTFSIHNNKWFIAFE